MTRRLPLAGAVLALAVSAVAAPVPKESGAAMLKRVYGEVTDPDPKVKCEPFGADGLKVTVPKLVDGDEPHIGRLLTRDVTGDFVLTVRITHKFNKLPKHGGDSEPYVCAGIDVSGTMPNVGVIISTSCLTEDDEFAAFPNVLFATEKEVGAGRGDRHAPNLSRHFRLTRCGELFTAELSKDGKAWTEIGKHTIGGIEDTLRVGPVADQRGLDEYVAEFDQYRITQPEPKGKE